MPALRWISTLPLQLGSLIIISETLLEMCRLFVKVCVPGRKIKVMHFSFVVILQVPLLRHSAYWLIVAHQYVTSLVVFTESDADVHSHVSESVGFTKYFWDPQATGRGSWTARSSPTNTRRWSRKYSSHILSLELWTVTMILLPHYSCTVVAINICMHMANNTVT